MNFCQFLKDLDMLGALLYTQAAGYTLGCVGLTQFLVISHSMEPGSLALEVIIDLENLRNGDSLGTNIAIITGSAGNQRLLAQNLARCQDLVKFLLAEHTCMGIFRNGHILLHLAGLVHTA